MSKLNSKQQGKPRSQRQLKVGEEIRHALSAIFSRGELSHPLINEASITVSEVRISPDLKNATAYVMPLAGKKQEEVLEWLDNESGGIRFLLSKKIHLKYLPRVSFRIDDSFDNASHINSLLNLPHVAQDLRAAPEADSD